MADFVDSVNFSDVKNANELMALFIKVARMYPNQANKLFNKYAAFIRQQHPEYNREKSRIMAASNISTMTTYYGKNINKLLYNKYAVLRRF